MTESSPANIRAVSERAQCLYSESEVEAALGVMAKKIEAELADANPVLLCVMNGAVVVTGKLVTRLDFPLQLDYIHATRYRDGTSGGELQWKQHPSLELTDRTVLIVDDILDEGVTLSKIVEYCKQQKCKRVYTAVLVNKIHGRRQDAVKADFVALDTDDHYLYGYGMDYKGYLRNAAGIFAVADEDI